MEKRKFDLVKEDIIPFEKFETGVRPRICKTSYSYEAWPSKLKVINNDTKQVTTFNGKFCGKRVMFKIDHDKGFINIEGIIKPPKDLFKRLFWEKGFTGARRIDNYTDIKQSSRTSIYIRDNNDIRHLHHESLTDLSGEDNTKIVLVLEPSRKTWWVSEDLTLEEAKLILSKFTDCQV